MAREYLATCMFLPTFATSRWALQHLGDRFALIQNWSRSVEDIPDHRVVIDAQCEWLSW